MIDVQASAYGLGDLQNLFLKRKNKGFKATFLCVCSRFSDL